MLDRGHRLVRSGDIRQTLRRGTKLTQPHLVCYILATDAPNSRFGFLVSRQVGNAPTRNLIKRRLRSAARDQLSQLNADVVVRVVPSETVPTWQELSDELSSCMQAFGQQGGK